MFEELDVALNNFGQRDISPAPELRSSRASDSRDGRSSSVVLDRDFLPLQVRQRLRTRVTIALSGKKSARVIFISGLSALNAGSYALGEVGNVGFADSSYRNCLTVWFESYSFKGRVFGQDLSHRAGNTKCWL